MWKDIFDILFSLSKTYLERKKENNKRLSNIFNRIADIIDSCIDLLEKDLYPHSYCQIMSNLSTSIVDELSDIMDMGKLVELESLLFTCSKLELEYANRKDVKTIDTLINASAKFRSLSILYS